MCTFLRMQERHWQKPHRWPLKRFWRNTPNSLRGKMMSYVLTSVLFFLVCLVLFRVIHLAGERIGAKGALEWGGLFLLGGALAFMALHLLTGGRRIDSLTALSLAIAAIFLYDFLQSWYEMRH